MTELIMARGLPGSGKTTWAKGQVEKSGGRYKRVNRDDLRAMLDAGQWSKQNERMVREVRDHLLQEALWQGFNVIVDDTNLVPVNVEQLRMLALREGAQFRVQDFTDVTMAECIRRDLRRPNSVGSKVIRTIYNQHLAPKVQPAEVDPSLPEAVLCDVDGTLAEHQRSPHDYARLGTDLLIQPIADLVRVLSIEFPIIVVSARPGEYRQATLDWLYRYGVPFRDLLMRAEGDRREDSVVKEELFRTHIEPVYRVKWVLDDRDRVVAMWRRLGLTCLQCAEGDF